MFGSINWEQIKETIEKSEAAQQEHILYRKVEHFIRCWEESIPEDQRHSFSAHLTMLVRECQLDAHRRFDKTIQDLLARAMPAPFYLKPEGDK